MKRIIKIVVALFITTFANAQVTNGQYGLSISNATATSNTIDVTLTVTVLGPAEGMRLFGFQTSINFDTAIINGGTISASYVAGTRSPELSAMTFGTIGVATPGCIRIPLSSFSSGATSVDMTVGTTYTLGTYRISNTANWADGNANLWLQDIAQSGRTRSAVNGYPFGASTPQFAYSTTTPVSPPGLVLSHLQATPYTLPLGTLGVNDNVLSENYKVYPNITSGIVNVDFEYTSNAALEVYDINGKMLINKKLIDTRNQVDISNLPSAMYIFKLVSERGEIVEKIMKQ